MAATLQITIPNLIYNSIKSLNNRNELIIDLQLLCIAALAKSTFQTIAATLGAKLEIRVRLLLISTVLQYHHHSTIGQQITLIKEDAERVANATGNGLILISSAALTLLTSYYLLRSNIYFGIPLLCVITSSIIYLRYVKPSVEHNYRDELRKDEHYKTSVAELIKLAETNHPFTDADFEKNNVHLAETITAGYIYEKRNSIISFIPDITIAVCTICLIYIGILFYPDLFNTKLIVYMSYFSILSVSSTHTIDTALNLIGLDQSIKRIFGKNHDTK